MVRFQVGFLFPPLCDVMVLFSLNWVGGTCPPTLSPKPAQKHGLLSFRLGHLI